MATQTRPAKIITLDTETINLDGALKRIAVYDGVTVTYGYTFPDVAWKIEEWWKRGFFPHVYIHNADFDLRKIPEVWERGNVVWARTKKIGNKFARVSCKHYHIHDSLKLLPFSLEKLSKDFDLEHGKLDLWDEVEKEYPGKYTDKVQFLADCDPDDPIYLKYLGFDVIALYELLLKLMEVSGIELENFVKLLSTASMSKSILKNGYKGKMFMCGDVPAYDLLTSCPAWSSKKKMRNSTVSYEEVEYKMREAFYGGRTEVFTPLLPAVIDPIVGKVITGYHYDVNSLYPSVMIDGDFPIGYPEFENDSKIVEWNFEKWQKNRRGLGFIKAIVYIPPQVVPPLPAKMGKLAFVTGTISGTWSYTELDYAIRNCGVQVIEWKEQIHFKRTAKIFKDFVETFYALKEQGKRDGNSSLTAFAKLILNTAYGWTVLRRDDKSCFRDIKDLDKYKDTDKYITDNEKLGYVEIWDTVMSESIQVQIGAYVTSYARLVLLDALRMQSEKGTVYYCDTDSIVCDKPFPPEMVDPYIIGKWDLEAELYSALFLQPKVYTEEKKGAKDTIKFKGVSKAVQKELTRAKYEEIYGHLYNGDKLKMLIEKDRKTLPSLSVAQKRGLDPNQFRISDKSISIGEMGKRNFNYKRNTSTAWHMESLEMFETWNFDDFHNAPDDGNIFGGK